MATALHVPVLLVAPAAAPAGPRRLLRAMSFDVSIVALAESSAVAPLAPAPTVSIAAGVVARRAASRVVESAPTARVPAPELLPDQPAAAADPIEAPAPVQRDLSPLAAARSVPLEPNAFASGSRDAGIRPPESEAHVEARLAEGIPGLKRESQRVRDRAVGDLAQDLRSVALRPWALVRQPLLHYRYRFRGIGFDAVIQSDGSVKYRDKDGLHLAITQVLAAKEDKNGKSPFTVVPSVGLGDLSTWSEKIAGNDPHAAERRKFLEQTRALRDYLHQQAERRARETQGGRVDQ